MQNFIWWFTKFIQFFFNLLLLRTSSHSFHQFRMIVCYFFLFQLFPAHFLSFFLLSCSLFSSCILLHHHASQNFMLFFSLLHTFSPTSKSPLLKNSTNLIVFLQLSHLSLNTSFLSSYLSQFSFIHVCN